MKETKWTQFWDMHSGGSLKEDPFQYIYIEAPKDEAITIFYNKFGHNPERVTCTCCGEDYSIDEKDTLAEITAYHRGCKFDRKLNKYVDEPGQEWYRSYQTVEEYKRNEDVLVITSQDIKETDRTGEVPDQGYVWID